ncbi:hemagglutinin repeat-containing protein [Marinomonas sp.]|uniref:hemagglutinin repeat-containing protein n=1 Tax=Marinomonas sp. TaxID=1904862 RepID=UPI003BAD6DB0
MSVADTASLQANNVTIDAAHEQTVVTTSHTDETVSGKGASFSSEKGEATIASLTETDQTERTTTTANTWAGSDIHAGNLKIKATNKVAVLASDINVQNNASITGENILVGGREATTETTHDSITKTNTISVGVKNAYADTYLAVRALDQAKDAVSDAKAAYDEAKQKVAEGKLPESDLDFYENKLDSAKKSEKLASLAVVNAGVTATLSSATAGFTATAGVSTQVTTNTTTATQSNWNGSTINVGNNASLNGQNNLTVEGSAISAQGTLEANAKNIDILAGKNTYAETTSSQTKGASASVTASLGGGVSGSVGVNTSESNSNSQSTQYSNSSLSAGTLKSNSDQLSIQGGNLSGNEVVINTNNLDVVSQQATSTSHSESQGKGINLGGSANSDSVSVSYNQSETDSDYASVTQQSSITAGDQGYQINVAGNTNLVGGLITSTDKAEASGNNAFSTGTLTQKDLANHAVYSGSSMGVDVGISSNTDSHGDSGFGFSNSMGQGSAGDSRQSTTQSGINTANLAITDADKQQALTGQSVSQTLADIKTTTSTDTAQDNSGVLKNTFNQADVEQEINNQREVTQAFSKNVQEVKGAITNSINKQKDELNAQLKNGRINQTEYDQQTATLDNYSLLANTISAGLSVPTDSLAGQVAAAASPAVANQIGQYFKGLAADNENGQLSAGQETAHVLAHGILAAAVASAGGNDATTAGIAAAGSEAAAPAVAKWLYGTSDPEKLSANQKQTITSIMGAASTTVGTTTGNVNNAIAAGQAGQNAVENNYLTTLEMGALVNELIGCEGDSDCQQETREKYEEISDQNVQNMVANCAAGGATSDACLAETKQQGLAITDLQSGKYDAFSTGTTEDDILNVFRDINLKDKTLAGELAAGAAVDELAAQYGWSKEQTQAVTMAVVALATKKGMRNAKGADGNATSAGSDATTKANNTSISDKVIIVPKEKANVFDVWQKAADAGELVRTDPKTVRGSGFRKRLTEEKGSPPSDGVDADHIVELCVGGADCAKSNGQWLKIGPNRSSGPKVFNQVKNDPLGTVYNKVELEKDNGG